MCFDFISENFTFFELCKKMGKASFGFTFPLLKFQNLHIDLNLSPARAPFLVQAQ